MNKRYYAEWMLYGILHQTFALTSKDSLLWTEKSRKYIVYKSRNRHTGGLAELTHCH